MERLSNYYKFIPIMLIVIIIGISLPQLKGLEVSDILEFSPESPFLAALILLGIYCIKSVVMVIPVVILYISAGIMFPTGWAIVLTYFGLFCEMSIGYFVGKRRGGEKVIKLMEKNKGARQLISYHEKNNSTVCFIARFFPLPFDLVNMFFGATGTRYWQFVVFSFLGLTPGMIPYVLMGNAVTNPLSKEFLIPFVICGIVTACTFIIYQKWRKEKAIKDNDREV